MEIVYNKQQKTSLYHAQVSSSQMCIPFGFKIPKL